MYVNLRQPGFNPHSHFAFLRYKDDDILLIAVNFSRESATLHINIPEIAFEMAKIPVGTITTTDLLWQKHYKMSLAPDHVTSVFVGASDAVILPLGKSKK